MTWVASISLDLEYSDEYKLPENGLFAAWLNRHALPLVEREIVNRPITRDRDDRIFVCKAPYNLVAWKDAGKTVIHLYAWVTPDAYRWKWIKATFMIASYYSEGNAQYIDVKGWTFGNVGLHRNKEWILVHLPSGLNLGAQWSKISAAKSAVEEIHEKIPLQELDNYESWSRTKKKRVQAVIKWAAAKL